jgi:ABC-2 type transport system permease protein
VTQPEPEPTAATPSAGAIYDLGYRGYDGVRLGRRGPMWALFVSGLRAMFGLGRSGRAKIIPFGVLAFASLPAVVQSAILATAGPIASRAGGVTYDSYLFSIVFLVVIFLAAQAPELLGGDQRHRVLTLYFAHAMERVDYALAKLAAMLAALLVITIVPVLILFIGQTFAAKELVDGFREQLKALPGILVGGLLYALIFAAIGMAIAAFTPRRAYATAAIVAVFLIGNAVEPLLRRSGTGIGDWPVLLNANAVAEGVRYALFGGTPNGPVANASLGDGAYAIAAAVIVVVGIAVYLWRYQRIEA